MVLHRWFLALLFCAIVSVAWGQDAVPPPLRQRTPSPTARPEDPFGAPTAPASLDVVVIEVTIAQWRAKPAKEGEERSAPSLENVDLATLEKSGELRVTERIRLTTLDQLKAMFQRGENVPLVSGVNTVNRGGGTFGPQRTVNYQQVGTMLSVTPRIVEGRILVEAKLERSSVERDGGPVLDKDEDGEETRAPSYINGTTQTTVSLTPGKAMLIGGLTSQTKDASSAEVVLISADVLK